MCVTCHLSLTKLRNVRCCRQHKMRRIHDCLLLRIWPDFVYVCFYVYFVYLSLQAFIWSGVYICLCMCMCLCTGYRLRFCQRCLQLRNNLFGMVHIRIWLLISLMLYIFVHIRIWLLISLMLYIFVHRRKSCLLNGWMCYIFVHRCIWLLIGWFCIYLCIDVYDYWLVDFVYICA